MICLVNKKELVSKSIRLVSLTMPMPNSIHYLTIKIKRYTNTKLREENKFLVSLPTTAMRLKLTLNLK